MASEHTHKWTGVAHLDFCHHYGWTYSCACGATASTDTERDPTHDPYSLVWMDNEGGEPCARCDEIRAGAKVKHTVTITAKDGTIERDETTERLQGEEMPPETIEKQTPEQIIEDAAGGREATAFWLAQIRADADNFVDQFRDPNAAEWPRPIDWELVDQCDLPRAFIEALNTVATFEVLL